MSSDLQNILSVTLFPEVWQSPQPRRMVYRGQLIVLTEEEYADLLTKLPEFWHTDNDKLVNFRYTVENTYFCERIKRVYNYASKEWVDTPYVFDAGSKEAVDDLLNAFVTFYQEYKLKEIQNINDQILDNVKDLSYVKMIILNSRERMLKNTDFMFTADYKFKDENTKEAWIAYRQELRDITEQDAWKNNDYANIQIPVAPLPINQLTDLVSEIESYVPAHFKGFVDDSTLTENVENIVQSMTQYMIKNQIIDGISKMSLPLFDLRVGTFDIVKSSENVETFMSDFNSFKSKIDEQLQEIGSTLTVQKIIEEMTYKAAEKEVGDEVFDIINELNQSAE